MGLTEELTTATTTHLTGNNVKRDYPKNRVQIRNVNFCSFHNTLFIFVRYTLYQTRKLAPVFQPRQISSGLKVGCQRVKKSVSRLFCINYLYSRLELRRKGFEKILRKANKIATFLIMRIIGYLYEILLHLVL